MANPQFSVMRMFRLDGEVAFITGAADGIGRIAALALAEAGAKVAVTDIDGDAAQATAGDIRAAGGMADGYTLDVADPAAIQAVVAEVAAKEDRIDVLVNNAGIALREPTADFPLESWQRLVDINQNAVFLCSREAGRHMLRQGSGRIINVASIMGLVGGGFYPNLAYHATKGAVVNMTRGLAAEWARQGVRVNAIAPTFVRTKLTENLRRNNAMMTEVERRTPMGRLAEPEEMAGGILYLASSASSMVTGHTLVIDGGWTAV